MSNISNKIIQARSNLILDEPFFGTLALRLKLVEDSACKTFWTDGQLLGFSPKYLRGLTMPETQGIICHEVMHVACGHVWRRDARDKKQWNIAADYAINPIILGASMVLPNGSLIEPIYKGLSAEEIYARLERQSKSESVSEGGQRGEDEDFGCGEVRDAEGEDMEAQEAEWKVAVLQAAQAAQAQERLPAGIERVVDEIHHPKIDWKAFLHRFMQQCAKQDYSWRYPNRRYLGAGIYLPDLRSEQMPPVVVYWDTSGSRDSDEARKECAAEIAAIIEEVKPERTYVIYGDVKVQRVDEFEAGDPMTFNPIGGGGTDFRPIFNWIAEQGIEPACFIGITDMLGSFPEQEPDYSVLWVSTINIKGPFGETIELG